MRREETSECLACGRTFAFDAARFEARGASRPTRCPECYRRYRLGPPIVARAVYGTVTDVRPDFAFIRRHDAAERLFAHRSGVAVQTDCGRLRPGMTVRCDVATDVRRPGRCLRAVNLRLHEEE